MSTKMLGVGGRGLGWKKVWIELGSLELYPNYPNDPNHANSLGMSQTKAFATTSLPDMWHLTFDTWHMTHDMWHMVWGEHSLKILAPKLFRLGIDNISKILSNRMTYSISEIMKKVIIEQPLLHHVC